MSIPKQAKAVLLILLTIIISRAQSWISLHANKPPSSSSSTTRRRTASMTSSSSSPAEPDETKKEDDDKDSEILMLSGYPFYINGPDPKDIARVAEEVKTTLQHACDDHQLVAVDRMGSSAIDGIAGTPVCDIVAQLSPWPMTDDAKAKLAKAGYEFQGQAPHDPQDEWFFGGDAPPGHLGRVVLHTVPEGSQFVRDMKAFVEYVNSHPDAFQRYNNVKVEGARLMLASSKEDGRLLGYKGKKAKVCNEIKQEAIEWWVSRNENE